MRLSEWRVTARGHRVMTARVAAAYEPALAVLGAPADPVAFVAWGDDPDTRYTIMAASDGGLIIVNVRVNVPQEGPRAAGKLVRWSRVQTGELAVEAHHGHRYLTAQVEGYILQGVDDSADQIGAWVAHVFARIDGRVSDGAAATTARRTRTPKPGASSRASRRSAAPGATKSNARSTGAIVHAEDPLDGAGPGG
jgi:hypothetical protein